MKVPVHNESAMPIYVHGLMILPGETRHFDENDVPHHLRPSKEAVVAAAIADPLADLLDFGVKDIAAQLETLSDDDLDRLGEMEQLKGDAARKTLLSAIAEESLSRAEKRAAGDPEAEAAKAAEEAAAAAAADEAAKAAAAKAEGAAG